MRTSSNIKKIKIVFFSGTGSTAKVARGFEKNLKAKEKIIISHEINKSSLITDDKEDMLIIIYPVHALNAPEPVYDFIKAITTVEKIPAVVISVSGGGEITPNTACRLHCIKLLEKKGYEVIYEKMIVMPSNIAVSTVDGLAIRLLEILPKKIEKVVNDLLTGVNRRTTPDLLNRMLSRMGEMEKYGARFFGKMIRASDNCSGCGWCEKACPRSNIIMVKHKPHFQNSCAFCLKCIYGCPQKALTPGVGKFMVLKQGYDLQTIEKRIEEKNLEPISELAKGYFWKGVKEYLLEDE